MTAYALITGTIFRAPTQRTAKSGKPFTTCTVKVGADDGGGDFWSIICFSESGQLELLRLEVGDAVSCRGKMELKTYTANDGSTRISRSIFADAVLGLRPVPRSPKAKAAKSTETVGFSGKPAPTAQGHAEQSTAAAPFDDDIPF